MRITEEQVSDLIDAVTEVLDWSEVEVSVHSKRRGDSVVLTVSVDARVRQDQTRERAG